MASSPSGKLIESAIRTPDQRLRVFVSSTLRELGAERRAARMAIESLRLSPVMFEAGARPHLPRDLYRAYLAQSDVFVGIYGTSYGWVAPGMEMSGLEDEYRLAGARPKLVYVKDVSDREARLQSLLRDIANDRVSYRAFQDAEELRTLITDDLAVLLTERFHVATNGFSLDEAADSGSAPLPIPANRASIGVLPFENFSGDPGHEYFVDGMVEDIITALSRFKGLAVVARASTFAYKGQTVDVREFARDLGVRYVLEGSVQRAGPRVRINGQLIDAANGIHLWADRFEGDLGDVFEMQDRITEQVVSALEPQIRRAEIERARRERPENLDAYDLFLRAVPKAYAMRPEDNSEALGLLGEAMRLDPDYVPAAAFAAWCYEQRVTHGWPGAGEEDAREAVKLAGMMLAAGTDDANVMAIAGCALVMVGHNYDVGLEALARAVELNPNSPLVLMNHGWANAFAGDLDVALASLNRARGLSRHDPAEFFVLTGLAMTHLLAGRCDEAAEYAAASAAVYDAWEATHLIEGCALACAGRLEEARGAVANLMESMPGVAFSDHLKRLPFRDPGRRAIMEGHMRSIGLPQRSETLGDD